ncbi:MAG: HesA/MoeB/ThiF family protein [bacterium]|nr:HesA/MoeB/ThiF family protein [bacterium]
MLTTNDLFTRNLGALTKAQQEVLHKSRAAVIGCGGLGCYVVEELVRLGLGSLQVFDPDVFSPSNCNRQLYALQETLGHNKAEVAARRARQINPLCSVQTCAQDFRQTTAEQALQVDIVLDCLDTIPTRLDLAELCLNRNLPLVHAAVHGWYGQVGVQLPGTNLLTRLYPKPREQYPQQSPPVLAFTVAVVASLQVAEVVKWLLNLPSPLHNTYMQIDLKSCDFQLIA